MPIRVLLRICVPAIFLCGASFLCAQNLLVNNDEGNLLNFSANGCMTEVNLNIGSYTDIATHPDGFLYGINSGGQLFEIDMTSGVTAEVHNFPGGQYFALTADAEGLIFAASGSGALASYQPATGEAQTYANMGYSASGDLTFYQGQMYMATFANTIVSIHPESPELNEVFIDFSGSGATIFGIVSSVEGCTVETYAFSNDNSARVYQIDWENQDFNLVCTIPHRIFGGASEFEFAASASLVEINEIILENDGCGDALSDVQISAESDNGGILYSLDNENFQSSDTFTDLEPGNYTVYLEDAGGCIGNEDFIVFSAFAEVTGVAVTPASCGNANGSISVIGMTGSGGIGYAINGGNIQQSDTFNGLTAGEYEVTVSDLADCDASVTVMVEEADIENLVSLNVINTSCGEDNGSAEIAGSFGNGELSYGLNGGAAQASNVFTNLSAGTYNVEIQDTEGCMTTLTGEILPSDFLTAEDAQTTAASCGQANGSAVLTASTDDVSYSLDGENFTPNNVFSGLAAGTYTAFYQAGADCTLSAEFTVPASEVSCDIYVPSAFSPNDDGINDTFKAYAEQEIILTSLLIYDRWGELIFSAANLSTDDFGRGWDGTFRGKPLEDGIYVYVISYRRGAEQVLVKGDVSLLR